MRIEKHDGAVMDTAMRSTDLPHGAVIMAVPSIPDVLEELRAGRPVIVVDALDRENEGDVILAAETATASAIAWMVRVTSGYICAPMTNEIADRLALPLMVTDSQDPRGTAYTISADASDGISTGISASDRAHTLRVFANPTSSPGDLIRPGHVLPLRAVDGGVRVRPGHTEAAVELMKLAGLTPVAAIAEVVDKDGEMMRLPNLIRLGAQDNVKVITIADLLWYLDRFDGVR